MNTELDWGHYRTFLAVVEERSLSGGARRLGLTQPTVARHMDALEKAVGADLFSRSPWVVMHENPKTGARCRAVFDAIAEGLGALSAAPSTH